MIRIEQLRYRWPGNDQDTLSIERLAVESGERFFLRGPSGCGKSTLLSLLGGIITPDSGTITVNDQVVSELNASERDRWRSDNLGLIFQQFNLLPFLSITENVLLPCRFSKQRRQRATAGGKSLGEEAHRLLQSLDLDPADFSGTTGNVGNLSVGQQQRVAAARALIGAPPLILADEPTAALDTQTRDRFIALLLNEAHTAGSTVFVVSHDLGMVPSFDRDMDLVSLLGNSPVTAIDN